VIRRFARRESLPVRRVTVDRYADWGMRPGERWTDARDRIQSTVRISVQVLGPGRRARRLLRRIALRYGVDVALWPVSS
jgi:hypothetical protein